MMGKHKKKGDVVPTTDAVTTEDTHITVILDRSGSMSAVLEATREGFDRFVDDQRKIRGDAYLSLHQFDTAGDRMSLSDDYVDAPLEKVTPLHFVPRGATPLLDAVGTVLTRMLAAPPKGRVMILIITDGHENASLEFDRKQVIGLVGRARALGWEFIFMGADIDAYEAGTGLGIAPQATYSYRNDAYGTQVAYAAVSSTMARSRTTGAALDMTDQDRVGGVGKSGMGGANTVAGGTIDQRINARASSKAAPKAITKGDGTTVIPLR